MLPMITTLCKQQMRVYGLTRLLRNAQASLRDAQALEQAGVGTRFDVLQSQVQLMMNSKRLIL